MVNDETPSVQKHSTWPLSLLPGLFLSYEVSEKKNDQRDHHAKAERDVPWHTALFSRFPRMEHAGQRKG
jgi:hypothetical protein